MGQGATVGGIPGVTKSNAMDLDPEVYDQYNYE
jgi:hypothetical protein